jgi:SAM-dependent methyltransferase
MSADPLATGQLSAAPRYEGTENLEAMLHAKNYNEFLHALVASVIAGKPTAMDFGAGIGTFAGRATAHVQRVICLEPDDTQSARLKSAGFEVCTSLDAVPDHSIDTIYTLNVLEHIADDRAVLVAIHKKLRPGGKLLVYVPAFAVLFSDMDRLVGHERRYSLFELKEKLVTAGFLIESARYADSIGFFASLAYKLAGRGGGRLDTRSVVVYDRYLFPLSRRLDTWGVSKWFGKNVYAVAASPRPHDAKTAREP